MLFSLRLLTHCSCLFSTPWSISHLFLSIRWDLPFLSFPGTQIWTSSQLTYSIPSAFTTPVSAWFRILAVAWLGTNRVSGKRQLQRSPRNVIGSSQYQRFSWLWESTSSYIKYAPCTGPDWGFDWASVGMFTRSCILVTTLPDIVRLTVERLYMPTGIPSQHWRQYKGPTMECDQ